MTDYLELLEEGADALLEQARRLEQALIGKKQGGEGVGEAGNSPARSSPEEETAIPTGMLFAVMDAGTDHDIPEWTMEPAGALSLPQTESEAVREEGKQRGEALPLLEQLRRLEAARTAVPAAGGATENGTGFIGRGVMRGAPPGEGGAAASGEMPWLPGGRESAAALIPGGRISSGGEAGWAEQADRVFRRDSRRYDGGFYLY